MSGIAELTSFGQLAEASYADFANPNLTTQAALQANRFSEAQAINFVLHWKVVHHQPNTSSGFSSTLFESLDQPGRYVYVLRGTEMPWKDLVIADLNDIVMDGLALDQIVDMYNDWKRITAGNGQVYTAARMETLLTETTTYRLAKAAQLSGNVVASAYLR